MPRASERSAATGGQRHKELWHRETRLRCLLLPVSDIVLASRHLFVENGRHRVRQFVKLRNNGDFRLTPKSQAKLELITKLTWPSAHKL